VVEHVAGTIYAGRRECDDAECGSTGHARQRRWRRRPESGCAQGSPEGAAGSAGSAGSSNGKPRTTRARTDKT
jgi:hypothetical protein